MLNWLEGKNASYVDVVWQAVTSATAFAQFRRNLAYTMILEHVTEEEGRQLDAMLADADLRSICRASALADTIGTPRTFDFEGHAISPTTLRYAKVAQDLVRCFPCLTEMRSVAEIGIGYGGQARMLSEFARRRSWPLARYTLVDMQPVVLLGQKYLDHFNVVPRCEFLTKSQLDRDARYDLVISNYAFAEFDRALQDEYFERIVSRARSGYLTMNTGLPGRTIWNEGAYTIREILAALPNAVLLRDEPLTVPTNYIVVFGDHAVEDGLSVDAFLAALEP